ncbi:hypothetical protein BJV82DRAFT_671241 [Fennellomyces sp. T-0311]|nr:hypothetical protein BJV82DRAFT_671241 [Fennellomyces sp. T-0311]
MESKGLQYHSIEAPKEDFTCGPMHFGIRRFEKVLDDVGPDRAPVTLRALIPSHKVGSLIGKQGQVHKQIQDLFNVHIYMLSHGDHHGRLANVFGAPHAVAQTWRDALFRMYGAPGDYSYGQNVSISFLVPTPLIEWFVEHDLAAKIHRMTTAGIHLRRTPLRNTTDHLLTISIGNMDVPYLDTFEKAVCMLAIHFQNNPDKCMSPYNVYYMPNMTEEGDVDNSSVADDRNDIVFSPSYEDDKQWHEEFNEPPS